MTVSEVKKLITRYSRDFDGNLTIDPNGPWVLAEEARIWAKRQHDAAQSELTALKAELASEEKDHAELRDVVAALREELAITSALLDGSNESYLEWRRKAEAAEQRNAELQALTKEASTVGYALPADWFSRYAALKPTESGASE